MRYRWLDNGYGANGMRGCGRRYMRNGRSRGLGYGCSPRSMRYGGMGYMGESYMSATDALSQERAFIEQRLEAIDRQLNQDK